MSGIFQPSDMMAVIKEGKNPPNCDQSLQIKAIYAENGVARGIWHVEEKFLNGSRVAMGGYLSGAADIMIAYAISSKLTDTYKFTSIDLHTTFHRPVLVGKVEVEARVDRLGKRLAYVVADLFQNGKKAVTVASSLMIIPNEE